MCAETVCLAVRLEGPLQAWGSASQYNRRLTDVLPSRSAVTGMLCAALGLDRGSAEEAAFLQEMADVRMLAVAVPRRLGGTALPVRRLEDYHTVQDTAKADGGLKDCHITRRQYLLEMGVDGFKTDGGEFPPSALPTAAPAARGSTATRKVIRPSIPILSGRSGCSLAGQAMRGSTLRPAIGPGISNRSTASCAAL